jgi:tRNA threonylcarbamoyladenosine biosynthesis protein TsaB
MSWILNIDTSLETADVTVAKDGNIICSRSNENQKDHASFLEPAIQSTVKEAGIRLAELSAVAVVYGPGSYTGLRVGMASAKGLCYALNKPLIVLNNLELLCIAAIQEYQNIPDGGEAFFCPMIDARRMEVYTAVYDKKLNIIKEPSALILEPNSYDIFLTENTLYFCGNGSEKWKNFCSHKNARFMPVLKKKEAASQLSAQKLVQQSFTPIAYAEPLYIKEYYGTQSPSKSV